MHLSALLTATLFAILAQCQTPSAVPTHTLGTTTLPAGDNYSFTNCTSQMSCAADLITTTVTSYGARKTHFTTHTHTKETYVPTIIIRERVKVVDEYVKIFGQCEETLTIRNPETTTVTVVVEETSTERVWVPTTVFTTKTSTRSLTSTSHCIVRSTLHQKPSPTPPKKQQPLKDTHTEPPHKEKPAEPHHKEKSAEPTVKGTTANQRSTPKPAP